MEYANSNFKLFSHCFYPHPHKFMFSAYLAFPCIDILPPSFLSFVLMACACVVKYMNVYEIPFMQTFRMIIKTFLGLPLIFCANEALFN